jgi:hypothetical protein
MNILKKYYGMNIRLKLLNIEEYAGLKILLFSKLILKLFYNVL